MTTDDTQQFTAGSLVKLNTLATDLNRRTYLADWVHQIWPDIEHLDIWNAAADLTIGRYQYLLHLMFKRKFHQARFEIEKLIKAHKSREEAQA